MQRAVVTGLGSVCSLGTGTSRFWGGLLAADTGPQSIVDSAGQARRAYAVADRDGTGRASTMAVSAAVAALTDAGYADGVCEEAGVVLGTGLGDVDGLEHAYATGAPAPADSPFGVSAAVATRIGATGPVHTVSTGCSAGVYALGLGPDAIRSGEAEVMVVGGAEVLSWVAFGGLEGFGLLDPQVCRPFDTERRGMLPGEGAAVLVLESLDRLRRRRVRGYAEVMGFGWSSDGHHPTAPEPNGTQIRRALRAALADADVPATWIGAVLPHRAGIPVNDTVETGALADVLGWPAPVFATKAVLGHTAGAAGAFAALTGALVLRRRVIPPNAHVTVVDPECGLDVVRTGPVPLASPYVLISGTGFGGNNGALVLGGWPV
jgi:3-oxoacyl-[acyl-carrier-protein] synthase II